MRGLWPHPGPHGGVWSVSVPTALIIEADGGSRGNPGTAGYGALVRDADTGGLLAERAAPIGIASNNVAEYTGLVEGLQAILDLGLSTDARIEVRMDSKLVVEQMSGRWKIKHEDMRRLALDARGLISQIEAAGGSVRFTWVPREKNGAADALSNDGMDGKTIRRDHLGTSSDPAGEATAYPPADTFGVGRAPVADVFVSDETVPSLEGMARLILVRHGVTEFTVTHKLDGRGGANPPLNATGQAQAAAAARAVEALLARSEPGPVQVVTSSLQRAQQTGQAIADRLGLPRHEDRDWDEQAFGDWDGLSMGELATDFGPELRRLRKERDYRRPGGESRADMDLRVGHALARAMARAEGGTVVVATHRIALMSVLCRLLGVDHDRGWSIATAPASLTGVEFWPDGGTQVAFVNDTYHLHDLA